MEVKEDFLSALQTKQKHTLIKLDFHVGLSCTSPPLKHTLSWDLQDEGIAKMLVCEYLVT